jgi:large subunit ribosomal protein L30
MSAKSAIAHDRRYKVATSKKAKEPAVLQVKQIRSGIGRSETMRRTLKSLGLRHYQHTTTVTDTPSIQGMLYKVRHLIKVTPVEEK